MTNCGFWGKLTFILFAFLSSSSLYALDSEWVNQKLKEFDSDPKAFVTNPTHVEKYDPNTLKPLHDLSLFSKEDIQTGDYIFQKGALDSFEQKYTGKAHIGGNDQPVHLVDELRYISPFEMEQAGLRKAELAETPWSDDYWPIYLGAAAMRYADPRFPSSSDWIVNRDYLSRSQCSVDQLSPAEKYDLLMGDRNFTLTQAMLNDGAGYYRRTGIVERWMGLCHGWAAAAYMVPRPTHKITLLAADGHTLIDFYPSDIKALATTLYAKAAPRSRFIGGRCNQKNPATDSVGRILAPECFDTNPGTWHLSVVNQIGVAKRSFIMDSTYDYEVWNQPIFSYDYLYFNPKLRKYVGTIRDAIVSRRDMSGDPFARYRSPYAEYLVGVAMKVIYSAEVRANRRNPDSPAHDRLVAVNYLYDLELDRNFQIIGGEWYQNRHPDFLWTPGPTDKAVSIGDQYLARGNHFGSEDLDWSGEGAVPEKWRAVAQYASKRGQPLAAVVDTLVRLSRLSF